MFVKFAPKTGGGASVRIAESRREGLNTRQKAVLYIGSGNTREELESLLEEAEAVISKLKESPEESPEESETQLSLSGLGPPKKRKKASLPKWLLEHLESQEKKNGAKAGKRGPRRLSKRLEEKEAEAVAEAKAAAKAAVKAAARAKAKEILEAKSLSGPPPLALVITDLLEFRRLKRGFEDMMGAVYDSLGYSSIIQSKHKEEQWNKILRACVLARMFDPRFKREKVKFLGGEEHLDIPLEQICRMMGHLHKSIDRAGQAVMESALERFQQKTDVLFVNVMVLCFKDFKDWSFQEDGFCWDNNARETQAVLAFAANGEGCPLWHELFPGSAADAKALAVRIKKLKKTFSARRAVVAADREMFSLNDLEFLEKSGIDYVVAARLKSLQKAQREEVLAAGLNEGFLSGSGGAGAGKNGGKEKIKSGEEKKKESGAESCFMELNRGAGRRIMAVWSEKRAQRNARDRQRKIRELMQSARGGRIPISRLISDSAAKKYIKTEGKSSAVLDEGKIREDERWDGLRGIVTSVQDQNTEWLLERCRSLWRAGDAFRANRLDLKMKSMPRWNKRRIESHAAICFLAHSISYTIKACLERAGLNWRIEKIREVLEDDQSSIMKDKRTGRMYEMSGRSTPEMEKVYKAFHLKREVCFKPLREEDYEKYK